MKIDNKIVERAIQLTNLKKELWLERIPSLSFDEFGRALIKSNTKFTEADLIKHFGCNEVKLSPTFIRAFNQMLANNEYVLVVNGADKREISSGSDISIKDLVSNIAPIKDLRGRVIPVKYTKLLAQTHELWCRGNRYKELTRQKREHLSQSKEAIAIKFNLALLEQGNLYCSLQKISNLQTGRERYLTVNPLDFLTSSGGNGTLLNPTKYYSCLGLSMQLKPDHVLVEECQEYSSPLASLMLGKISNNGLIIQKNGYELNVPNTNFNFIGYASRVRCWLVNEGVFLEKEYPNNYRIKQEEVSIPLYRPETRVRASIQDESGNFEFVKACEHKNLSSWLDRVSISDSKLMLAGSND